MEEKFWPKRAADCFMSGARGTWYPNRGMEMADFDLEFTYPQGWTLVATGKPAPVSPELAANGE